MAAPVVLKPKPKSHRVLLIEEDPKQIELYSELIREAAECQVDVMARLSSPLEWFGRIEYQLVVADVSPLTEGGPDSGSATLEVLERVKRLSPMTAVILLSESATVEQAVAAIRMGAEDYLKKPFKLESFKLAVKRGLDRGAVFGASEGASAYLNLLNSCQMISATLEQEKIFGIVRSYLARELGSNHSAIYELKDGQPSRLDSPYYKESPDEAMQEIIEIALQASGPLGGMVAEGGFVRFVEKTQLTPGLFVFRFRCVGETDYFCVCLSPRRPESYEAFESRMRMLKTQIEVTGKNIQQYMGVRTLAYVDDATGLYNTRYMNQLLDREIEQAKSKDRSFAVLFIDADGFKQINDQHGHLVGTKLLNELGHLIRKFVRESDTVFRYGGDEFVAVLSPCDLATAQMVAERIRAAVEKRDFLGREQLNIHFTVSIGVALFPDHASSKKEIIDAADHAMYAAKRKSRNSVFIAELAPGKAREKQVADKQPPRAQKKGRA